MARLRPSAFFCLLSIFACEVEPPPLPTEEAVSLLDRNVQPPLYQMLYDAPVLPASQPQQQKVRLLIWLLHMELTKDQLRRMETLRQLVEERRDALEQTEQEVLAQYENVENQLYEQLWVELLNGTDITDPRMEEIVAQMTNLKGDGERESALLTARLEGLRSILDAERSFLITLTPRQELLLTDSLFFLRNSLDPVGNPGDFLTLVGSTYDPGEYAVLTRGTGRAGIEPLNIGALWSEEPELALNELHEARREVLLLLALMEPGLREALAAAHRRIDESTNQ